MRAEVSVVLDRRRCVEGGWRWGRWTERATGESLTVGGDQVSLGPTTGVRGEREWCGGGGEVHRGSEV